MNKALSEKQKKLYLIIIVVFMLVLGAMIYFFKGKEPAKNQQTPLNLTWQKTPVTIGSDAPLFSLKSNHGTEIGLADMKEQNVLLVFTSSQCEFSRQELPDLKKFVDESRGRVIVLAIYYKESPRSLRDYEEKEKINFPMLIDEDGKVFNNYDANGTPYHVLIDKTGKIAALWPSYGNLIVLQSILKSLEK